MRTSQEIANALTERLKKAAKNAPPAEPVDHGAEIFPGKRYRGERGGMVTVLRSSRYRVVYQREGYTGTCELSTYQFKLKFTEVKS